MKTADFFNLFKRHALGRRRNLGSYRVIDGDNCQVLVRSSTRYGVPNGSELIAITFTPEHTLWHSANIHRLKHSIRHDIVGGVIEIIGTILDENADNLLDSGIIEIDDTNNKMLIEIGDTPWLFEQESTLTDEQWAWRYNIGSKVDVRCASIAEALVALKPLPNTINGLGWVMERAPDNFKPDGVSPEDRVLLSKPVNPMDYGFQIEHCKKETTYLRGSLGSDRLCLMSKHASTVDGVLYQAACDEWNEALSRYDEMTPNRYENINTDGGEMVLVGGTKGVLFLRGDMCQVYTRGDSMNVPGWHKLISKSNKIRLKG